MKKNRWIALLLCLCMAFGLTACGDDDAQTDSGSSGASVNSGGSGEAPAAKTEFALAYSSEDTLHPFTLQSAVNMDLMLLLYDPLVKLDQDFALQNCIAESVGVSGTTCRVTVKSGLVFSDGTALTAADVAYSLNAARESGSYYKNRLANVASATAPDEHTLEITLKSADALFANNLDVPIIKKDSDGNAMPVGSGRYQYVNDEAGAKLVANPKWYGETKPGFAEIPLRDVPDNDALLYSLKLGKISYMFTSSAEGETSNVGSSSMPVTTNSLVYLGLNSQSGVFREKALRKAVNMAVDKDSLVTNGFSGHGVKTGLPLNPRYPFMSEHAGVNISYSDEEIAAAFEAAGYTRDGGFRQKNGTTLSVRLLLSSGNSEREQAARELSEMLKKQGVEVTIESKDYEAYLSALKSGEFDLYLGEVKLTNDLDLSAFFSPSGAASYGIATGGAMSAAYAAFRADTAQFDAFQKAFLEETPMIPLMFRNGVIAFSRSISGQMQASVSDIFYNIEQWQVPAS